MKNMTGYFQVSRGQSRSPMASAIQIMSEITKPIAAKRAIPHITTEGSMRESWTS